MAPIFRKIVLAIIIPLLFAGCTTVEPITCVYPGNFHVRFGEEFNYSGLKPVWTNGTFRVWISSYISPNSDGIRDTFVVFIEDIEYNTAFISYPYDVIDPIHGATNDPYDFLYEGSVAIYDGCRDIAFTNNVNGLYWRPLLSQQPEPGVYNVDLLLLLTDNSEVVVTDYVEIVYPD